MSKIKRVKPQTIQKEYNVLQCKYTITSANAKESKHDSLN